MDFLSWLIFHLMGEPPVIPTGDIFYGPFWTQCEGFAVIAQYFLLIE